jgi:CRP/FNR family transcriptional regulator, cyclic AMP receptor protein
MNWANNHQGEVIMTLRHFKNATDTVTFAAGAVIFEEGEIGNHLYAIQSGQVRIVKGAETLELVDAGEIFGEMALVDNQPRSATAIAETDVELVPVDEYRFLFMVHETPTFAIQVMRTLAARLRTRNAITG